MAKGERFLKVAAVVFLASAAAVLAVFSRTASLAFSEAHPELSWLETVAPWVAPGIIGAAIVAGLVAAFWNNVRQFPRWLWKRRRPIIVGVALVSLVATVATTICCLFVRFALPPLNGVWESIADAGDGLWNCFIYVPHLGDTQGKQWVIGAAIVAAMILAYRHRSAVVALLASGLRRSRRNRQAMGKLELAFGLLLYPLGAVMLAWVFTPRWRPLLGYIGWPLLLAIGLVVLYFPVQTLIRSVRRRRSPDRWARFFSGQL